MCVHIVTMCCSYFYAARHNVIKELRTIEGAAAAGDSIIKMERNYGCVRCVLARSRVMLWFTCICNVRLLRQLASVVIRTDSSQYSALSVRARARSTRSVPQQP